MVQNLPEYLTENADGSITIRTTRPVTIDGASVSTVTMREPTVGDEIAASAGAGRSAENFEVTLFANLCTISPDAIRGMTIRNYKRMQEAYRLFTD